MPNDMQGTLSAPEAVIARHDGHPYDNNPAPAGPVDDPFVRTQVSDQHYEAQEMRKWYENQLKAVWPADVPWKMLTDCIDWAARELLAREKMERMGFLKRVSE